MDPHARQGGAATPRRWFAMDGSPTSSPTARCAQTTRQASRCTASSAGLKATIAAMNAALVDTIAACGDVNRNVAASSQ